MNHFNDLTVLKYDNEGKLERRFIEMTQKKSKTKNCHYIFKAYLKSWANSNNLKIYDKRSKKEIPKGFSISKHFSKPNLYNFPFDMLTNVRLFPLIYEDFKEMISAFMQENEVIIFYKNTEFDIYKKNL